MGSILVMRPHTNQGAAKGDTRLPFRKVGHSLATAATTPLVPLLQSSRARPPSPYFPPSRALMRRSQEHVTHTNNLPRAAFFFNCFGVILITVSIFTKQWRPILSLFAIHEEFIKVFRNLDIW